MAAYEVVCGSISSSGVVGKVMDIYQQMYSCSCSGVAGV